MMSKKIKIEYRKTDSISAYERNPRRNEETVERLVKSIQEYGFRIPIVIDKAGIIVCGHARLKAAVRMGMEEVPCIIADDLSEEQIRAFRLADNKTAEAAIWDYDLLSEEIEGLDGVFGNYTPMDFGFNKFESDSQQISSGDGDNQQDIQQNLPQELQGVNMEPGELQRFDGTMQTLMERVIITYEKEDAQSVCDFLGIEQIGKVVYSLEEILDARAKA